jgi:hypothetical protein
MPRIDRLLQLACLLDCDPLLLLANDIDAGFTERLFFMLARQLRLDGFPADRVVELYGPQPDWPNTEELRKITGQAWHSREFSNPGCHPPRYQAVEIAPGDPGRPRAYHFAYRRDDDRLWRPYGMAWIDEDGIGLNNFFRKGVRYREASGSATLDVSTHFGTGACDFRVASLNPFEFRLVERVEEIIRFDA